MSKNSTSKISMDEYPEISQVDLDRSVLRQNMKPVEKKRRITIMLDTGIIGYFKEKAGKRGYQTLINETLKKVISSEITESGSLEKTLRKIIREELSVAGNSQ
jgi:uncharacterized protein (DUF4415 family)